MEDDPIAGMITLDGLIVDARHVPARSPWMRSGAA
jgi:hypothetical protein